MREWLFGLLAIGANAGLFLGLAIANAPNKKSPVRTDLQLREVFLAAPPPRTSAPPAEPPREMTEAPAAASLALQSPTSSEGPAPERFDPRGATPGWDVGAPAGGGPALRFSLGRGGSAEGVVGGVEGGVPGGTGRGAAFSLSQVDRGPIRAVSALPPYPQWARLRKLEGSVSLRVTVDEAGRVGDVQIEGVEGDSRFGEVARDAVLRWRFEPAVFDGRKVACVLTQRVRFQLVD
ncbi:MAG TPA: TonB family protein [Planctomycetota bacterium]